jgi:hypothetical protein
VRGRIDRLYFLLAHDGGPFRLEKYGLESQPGRPSTILPGKPAGVKQNPPDRDAVCGWLNPSGIGILHGSRIHCTDAMLSASQRAAFRCRV